MVIKKHYRRGGLLKFNDFLLIVGITSLAYCIVKVPVLEVVSPMFWSMFIGMAFANIIKKSAHSNLGISFLGKWFLRCGVALLGVQLTIYQVFAFGISGFILLVLIVASTYVLIVGIGEWLGIDSNLCRLIAAGTSICGASAIAAVSAVEKGRDKDVIYAIACVTLIGMVAMLSFPAIGGMFNLSGIEYGFLTGASIHEVSQVAAAGFQYSNEAGEFAIMVKLLRVLLLAPLLFIVAWFIVGESGNRKQLALFKGIPGFLIGFFILVILNTLSFIPELIKHILVLLTPIILTAAVGAIGLGTRFSDLYSHGVRPLIVATCGFLYMFLVSFAVLPIV